jgi:hypothetical protein
MKKSKDKIELIEVLDDTRDEESEAPPKVTKTGDAIEDTD